MELSDEAVERVVEALADAPMGDARRQRRLCMIAAQLARSPSASLPEALKGDAQVQGAYRLFNNRAVSFEALMVPQAERTRVRSEEAGAVLVLHDTPGGPRVDLRYPLAALQPDDERRRTARAFHRAMLLSDLHALRRLAFDDRGLETLVDNHAPRGADEPLLAAVQAMPLVELGLGEPFVVPSGVQFVNARHLEMGITVLGGLTPGGEIPFLLRQRSGEWKVIPFHFLQAAAAARSASAS